MCALLRLHARTSDNYRCKALTNATCTAIANNLSRSLQSLSLSNCRKVS